MSALDRLGCMCLGVFFFGSAGWALTLAILCFRLAYSVFIKAIK